MPITTTEMNNVAKAFSWEPGYVLDFTDKTFSEFFRTEVGWNIDDPKYAIDGTSKLKRLRAFLTTEGDAIVLRALEKLWRHRETIPQGPNEPGNEGQMRIAHNHFTLLKRLRDNLAAVSLAGAVERFNAETAVEEVVAAIERDISAGKYAAALDELHTYCMMKLGRLLAADGVSPIPDSLTGRVGRYLNPIREARLRPITKTILKGAARLMQDFNDVRNKASLAHDNELPNPSEARYIFESVVGMLRFLRANEQTRFGS